MGKRFEVRGTVYHEYSVVVVADDMDTAREVAEGMTLAEWFDNGRSGVDVYETVEVDE